MPNRGNIRHAASTLAFLWRTAVQLDVPQYAANITGIENLLLAYPDASRALLCAHVVRQLHCQASSSEELEAFLDLLADIAGIEAD